MSITLSSPLNTGGSVTSLSQPVLNLLSGLIHKISVPLMAVVILQTYMHHRRWSSYFVLLTAKNLTTDVFTAILLQKIVLLIVFKIILPAKIFIYKEIFYAYPINRYLLFRICLQSFLWILKLIIFLFKRSQNNISYIIKSFNYIQSICHFSDKVCLYFSWNIETVTIKWFWPNFFFEKNLLNSYAFLKPTNFDYLTKTKILKYGPIFVKYPFRFHKAFYSG